MLLRAFDGNTGHEPWLMTDGTRENMRFLRNINPEHSPKSGMPRALQAVGGRLFFDANDKTSLPHIWTATRRTAAPFKASARESHTVREAAASHGLYYFVQGELPSLELWRTDGTLQGTFRIYTMPESRSFRILVPFRNGLLFAGSGRSMYFTDGTVAGTVRLVTSESLLTDAIAASNGLAWFGGGEELFRTDGSTTTRVALPPDVGVDALVEMGGDIYILNGVHGSLFELWRTNGLETHLVKRIEALVPFELRASATHVFFLSAGIWSSDGTEAGTKLIVPHGAQFCVFENARSFATMNGVFYWISNFGLLTGLWRSDGTAEGTYGLTTWPFVTSLPCNADNLIVSNGKLYFRGYDAEHGAELWMSDGTAAGTHIAADVAPGSASSTPTELTLAGDVVYFRAHTAETGHELFAYTTVPPPRHRSVRK